MKTENDTHCKDCRYWSPLSKRTAKHFPFAERLSREHGRNVRLGFCTLTESGPTADEDYCDKGEQAM